MAIRDRVWTYTRSGWTPPRRWWFYLGDDERGRRTVVLPIPFGGYLVVAYRTCHCADCSARRRSAGPSA